jgi:branched-chain amino acid transport system permease protein
MADIQDTKIEQPRIKSWFKLSTKSAIFLGVILIIALLPLLISSQYLLHIIILTFIYIVAAVSLRAINISGQFPLAHGAFMGIGAYAAGMASRWLNWPPWLTIPLGACLACAIGMLFGYPFSRLRALYYAMGSLFFGIAIISIIRALGMPTGGLAGLAGVHPIFTGPNKIFLYYYFFFIITVLSIIAMYRFEFSRIGFNLKAIAQSHLVAESVGINESRYRILAVGFGCFFVGLIGAAFAHYNAFVFPSSFDLTATFWMAIYVMVGGIGSFIGPIIGVPILYIIPELFRGMKEYSPYITIIILLIVVYLMPQGIVGLFKTFIAWLKSRKAEAKQQRA